MKKYIFYIILGFLITTSVSARKTGCEGNCVDGFGKWTYTDKTTYEGNWVGTKKMVKELKFGPMVIFIKENLKIVSGTGKEF